MLSGWVPIIGTPAGFQPGGEIERGLAAELHNHAFGFFLFVNVEHVLVRERLEVEFVARVVVGRNRFRIGVHHDGFETELAKGEGGVNAAVIEFDPLADAVGPTAEDHDFAFLAPADLVLVAVGGIVIRRVSLELGRAGIDEAVGGDDSRRDALGADFLLARA